MTENSNEVWSMTAITISFMIALVLLCFIVSATTINSQFQSDVTDGETTFYSHLEQSNLKESGYARGMETGSLNYLKGGRAKITDNQAYYDGNVDVDHPATSDNHNSSVSHNLDVELTDGEKGLSLYYAKGFYNNNRAISASKKIWFVDDEYPSNNITVDGSVLLDMGGIYRMEYDASADNSYFIFNDVSGLSNKTGSRRIEWEQEGLIKGKKIKVKNNLIVEDAFTARAIGVEDWLPCFCFTGTIPAIEPSEGPGSEWPSAPIRIALIEQKEPIDCNPGVVIVTIQGAPAHGVTASAQMNAQGQSIQEQPIQEQPIQLPDVLVESFFEKTTALSNGTPTDRSIYEFTTNVRNIGTAVLNEVQLVGLLPPTYSANNTSMIIGSGEVDGRSIDPVLVQSVDSNGSSRYVWALGDLQPVSGPEGMRNVIIKLNSSLDLGGEENSSEAMKFYAKYSVGGGAVANTVLVSPQNIVSTEEEF